VGEGRLQDHHDHDLGYAVYGKSPEAGHAAAGHQVVAAALPSCSEGVLRNWVAGGHFVASVAGGLSVAFLLCRAAPPNPIPKESLQRVIASLNTPRN